MKTQQPYQNKSSHTKHFIAVVLELNKLYGRLMQHFQSSIAINNLKRVILMRKECTKEFMIDWYVWK